MEKSSTSFSEGPVGFLSHFLLSRESPQFDAKVTIVAHNSQMTSLTHVR